jgi:lysylphosphatidylglycerol synthetase-like protein (DUF2156 family)
MSAASGAGVLRRTSASRLAAAVVLIPALLLGIAGWLDAVSVVPWAASGLAAVLPLDPTSASVPLVIADALCVFLLAIALARVKRLTWSLGLIVLAGGAVQQGLVLNHPVGAAVALACLAILLLDRRRYVVLSPAGTPRLVIGLAVLGVLAPVVVLLLAGAGTNGALGAAVSWLAIGDATRPLGLSVDGATGWLLALARVPWILLLILVLRPAAEPAALAADRPHGRDLALRYGTGALWPFQISADKVLFTEPGLPAVIAYGRSGRTACVVGDPMGTRENAWALFGTFLAECHRRDWLPAVYQASPDAREPLLNAGFKLYRIGQEAVLPLAGFNLVGRPRANLRHTITRARKGGVHVTWYPEGLTTEEADQRWPALHEMDSRWRKKAGPSLGFTIGQFERTTLEDRPISIAFDADDRPIAFTTFLPTGVEGGWVLDLMRREAGGVPGALEWCVAEAATELGRTGETTLSLSLAPLAGIGGQDAPWPERVLAAVSRLVRPAYDVRGLAFFKDKFDVRWEPRYLAIQHLWDLPSIGMGLLSLHLRRPQ